MTVDESDLKADMHRAIQAWFDCPITVRPSAFALGDRIRTIALPACAATTRTGEPDPRGPFFSTQWEREDYERRRRGELELGPSGVVGGVRD